MEILFWSIIGALSLATGITTVAAIIAMAGSKYRG